MNNLRDDSICVIIHQNKNSINKQLSTQITITLQITDYNRWCLE